MTLTGPFMGLAHKTIILVRRRPVTSSSRHPVRPINLTHVTWDANLILIGSLTFWCWLPKISHFLSEGKPLVSSCTEPGSEARRPTGSTERRVRWGEKCQASRTRTRTRSRPTNPLTSTSKSRARSSFLPFTHSPKTSFVMFASTLSSHSQVWIGEMSLLMLC